MKNRVFLVNCESMVHHFFGGGGAGIGGWSLTTVLHFESSMWCMTLLHDYICLPTVEDGLVQEALSPAEEKVVLGVGKLSDQLLVFTLQHGLLSIAPAPHTGHSDTTQPPAHIPSRWACSCQRSSYQYLCTQANIFTSHAHFQAAHAYLRWRSHFWVSTNIGKSLFSPLLWGRYSKEVVDTSTSCSLHHMSCAGQCY